MHTTFCYEVNKLGYDLKIEEPGFTPLSLAAFKLFHSVPKNSGSSQFTTLQESEDKYITFPINLHSSLQGKIWTCWTEAWESLKDKKFKLYMAGWHFFWGDKSRNEMLPILRAEWMDHATLPQPHWHINSKN